MPWFLNHYQCDRCQRTWKDEWSATCDDECPHCGARHMSPTASDDLTIIVDQIADGRFAVLRSPDTAEHDPNYAEVAAFPTKEEAQAFIDGADPSVSGPGNGGTLAPALPRQAIDLQIAIARLKDARDHLKRAACPSTLRKVRSALKSAEGAERHMARRLSAGGKP